MHPLRNSINSPMNISLRYLYILAMCLLTRSMAQTIDIRLANNNNFGTNDRGSYNTNVSTVDNGGVTGGIVVLVTDATVDDDYKVYVQYHTGNADNANQWFSQQINEAGNTKISIGSDGTATQYIPHAAIEASDDWQGDDYDGNVTWIIVNDDLDDDDEPNTASVTQHYETYDFDMIVPTISDATISATKDAPFNQTYPHYAKEDDQMKIVFTSSEAISTLTGNFHGNSNISAQSLDSTSPFATIDAKNTMPDGATVTFAFILKDANGNAATVTATTDNSSIITDFTPPNLNTGETYYVAMATGQGDYYAKSGDQVTLTIKASETLVQGNFDNNGATDESAYMVFNIGTETDVTVSPALSGISGSNSSEFSATVTLTDDNETSNTYVNYTITGIYDRAGNETSITANIPTVNDQVYYDSTDPTVNTMVHQTPDANANPNPYKAKNGDAVKLYFGTEEVLDYNWDDGINTQPTMTFQGGNGTGNIFNASTISNGDNLQEFTATLDNVSGLSDGRLNFSLSFRDLSGNAGTAVTGLSSGRRVHVDNTSAGLDNLQIASSSTSDDDFAKPGETVTVTIDADEELRNLSQYDITGYDDGISGTIGGVAADVDLQAGTGGEVWILSATMGDAHPEGLLEFSATLTDMTGNTTVVTQADITDGSTVTYDKSAPTIVSASIISDNTNTTWAKEDDVVTLEFEVNETLKENPTVTIAGAAGTQLSVDAKTYTYTIDVAEGTHEENVLVTNPNVNFTIDFTNEANIAGTQYTHESDGVTGTVTIDYTPPTLTNVYIKSDNSVDTSYAKSGSNVTLKFKGVDALSSGLMRDDLVVTFDDGNPAGALQTTENGDATDEDWTATAELGTGVREQSLTFRVTGFKDLAGNEGTAVTALSGGLDVTYDETVPRLSGLTMTSDNDNSDQLSMVGDAVAMVITVNETVEANGIQIPAVTIAGRTSTDGDVTIRNAANNGDASQGDLVFTANYTMQTDDTETDSIEFQVAFTDLAGNVGTAITSLISDQGVSFDKTSPDFTNTAISSSIHIESDNDYDDDGAIATVTDVITLTLTSAEALKTSTKPTVTILGVSANVSPDGDNKIFTATHTITGSEAGITNNQVIYFNVAAGYTDETGNVGSAVTQAAASFENADLVSTDGTYVLYDITAPVFDPVRIRSSNANDTTLAVAGETITLTMVSDTPIRTDTKPTITIAGNTIADGSITRASNTKFVATYDMQNNSNDNEYDDPDTKIPIRITAYDDVAGNTGDAVTNTSDPTTSYVIYDNTDPDLQQVTIASNADDSDPSLAIPGSTITLQFTCSDEEIQEPTVTIVGRPPDDLTGTNNNKTWTATIVMLEDDDDAVDPIPFSVAYSDLAGNDGADYDQTGTTDGSSISFDKTKPTLSAIYMRSESSDSKDSTYINPDNNISLRFKVSEPLAALDIYINNERGRYPSVVGDPITITKLTDWTGVFEKWKASYTITDATDDNDGEGAVIGFTIDFTDLNAYAGTQVNETTDDGYVTFDKTDPTVETFTYLSNNGTTTLAKLNDDITASLTASELIQAPVMKISDTAVTETQDGTDRSWTATHEMVADNDEGQIELNLISFMDYAGNTGTARTTTTNDVYVTYDQTAPVLRVVSVSSDNNYSSQTMAKEQDVVTITLSTTDSDNVGENISEPTISMLGSTDNVTIAVGGNAKTWTATKTVVSTHDEGEVQFSITYTDLAGNSGASAATAVAQDADGNVTVDLTKTDVSSLTPNLNDASDSGVDNSDDLTSVTKPTFSLSGLTDVPVSASNDSIYIVVGTDTTIRSKVNSNEMTFTIPADKALSNQNAAYAVTVVTKDLAGNLSDPSNTLSLRIDTQGPDLGFDLDLIKEDDSGFSDQDNKTNVRTPRFRVAALPAGKRSLVDIYYDTDSDTDVLAGSYRLSQPIVDTLEITGLLLDDTYTFSYFVTDSAGNLSSESGTTLIAIDSSSSATPSAPDLDAGSDKGTLNTDDLTNLSTIQFLVTGLSETDSVHIKNSSNVIVGGDLVAADATSSTVTVEGATTDTYKAYATDESGNVSVVSDGLLVTIDQDPRDVDGLKVNEDDDYSDDGEIEPVVIDLDSGSDAGALDNDQLTNNITPSFTLTQLTATDSIFLYWGTDSLKGYVSSGTSHEFTIPDSKDLADGAHVFTMRSRDYAGNLSGASNALTLNIDTEAYTLSSSPDLLIEHDAGISGTDDITNVRVPGFELSQLSSKRELVELYVDGVLVTSGRKTLDVLTDTLTIPNGSRLDEGTYSITYVVVDSAGNSSLASTATSVEIDFTAPGAPTVLDLNSDDDTGISDSDDLTNATTMRINTSSLTTGDFGIVYKVNAALDTTLVDSLIVPDDGSLTYTVTNDEDGTFNFFAVAQDTAGNRSANSVSTSIQIDQTAPDVTGVAIDLDDSSDTGVKNDDGLTNDTSPSFTVSNVTSTDSIFLFFEGLQNQKLKASATTVSFTGDVSVDGTYAVTIKSKDIAGNLSDASTSLPFRLDATPFVSASGPDLIPVYDSGMSDIDNITNVRVPEFEIIQLPSIADSLNLYVQSGITNQLSNTSRKIYNVTKDTLVVPIENQLGTGSYGISYTVIDSAGNTSIPSDTLIVNIDFTAPDVPGTPILESSSDFGESTSDKITNDDRISVTLADILDGYSGVLYSVDGLEYTRVDSLLLAPPNDPITFDVPTSETGTYTFSSVHVDTAGNRSGYGSTMAVEVDHVLPGASITFDGDSLVRSGDVSTLATFNFSEPMDSVTVPKVDVTYPGVDDSLNLTNQSLTESGDGDDVWTFAIPLNSAGLDTINGLITLSVSASDIAGNQIVSGDITGLTVLRVDNNNPTFSSVVPPSNSFNNVLNNFSWNLSESVDTGYVTFNKLADGSNVNVPLVGLERVAGDREAGSFSSGDPVLTEGLYNMIFTSVDTAGNTGRDTISNYTYDTTSSTAIVTFSELFASPGQVDTITVTFNEVMLATPTIQIGYPSEFDGTVDAEMTLPDSGDGTVWLYYFEVGDVTQQGNVTVGVTATDLATNALEADSIEIPDDLYIDNTDPLATFTYANISNPDLTNIGIGGDVVQVTITMNEPLASTEPIPSINYTYGYDNEEDGTTVTGHVPQSTSNGDSVWIFQVTLSDSVQDDGQLSFALVAEDRSNNPVNETVAADSFLVDNLPPTDFETGLISTHGLNPVQGWITGVTDTIGVQVPIQTFLEDSTLFYGGEVQIQFYNLNRGSAWVTVAPNDSITEAGPAEQFYRNINSLYDVMNIGTALLTGDSLAVRGRIVDRHGNITNGTTSGTRLAFDPTAPLIGEVSGGSFVAGDTLFSNDTISVQWTAFEETDEDESGLERYEVSILKLDSLNEGTTLYGWDTLPSDVTSLTQELFLEHDTRYVGHIRAFDVAGNISDTLVTDTLLRYNSNPVILSMANAVLDEDLFWTDTVRLTDLDLSVMQGDSFGYQATTTRILGNAATGAVTIDSLGGLTWTPTQDDTGTYTIQIVATDAYALTDTFQLPLTVNAVNDTPVFVIPSIGSDLYYKHEWVEDQDATELILSRYISDVDNDITTEITWQAVILDTSQLDEDYPLGLVIIGPNTPWEVHAKLNREYLGLDPQISANDMSRMSHETIQLINNTRTNPLIDVNISVKQYGEGIPDSVIATFSSDSNYHGDNHRVIFIAQDDGGAVAKDTIHASILAENDPPVIAKEMIAEVVEMWENDSLWMEFGQFVSDIDDTSLVFTLSAVVDATLGNDDKVTIIPSVTFEGAMDDVTFVSHGLGDSVLFIPEKLWDDHVDIQLKVSDENASDSTSFTLDVRHVDRPKIAVSLLQQNAFTKFLQVIVTDTASKTTNLSLAVQNQNIELDTVAAHTYSGHLSFDSPGNYSIDIYASGHVGDTTLSETFSLAAGKVASRWYGTSYDGRFSIIGSPGAITYDQPFLIADSTLFEQNFYDRASYVLGSENFYFNTPIEVRVVSDRDDLAIYRRKNGVTWQELPSLTIENEIFTLSDQSGYFRLGPKTIIVPEQTNIHQNYPNPFNPTTTITYDIGLLDGLRQNVSINVYNLLGQNIATLVENKDQIGQFKIQWDGYDKFGQQMASGVYFIQLSTKTGIVKNKKMMLLK